MCPIQGAGCHPSCCLAICMESSLKEVGKRENPLIALYEEVSRLLSLQKWFEWLCCFQ